MHLDPIQHLELAPVTERHLYQRRQVRSRFKKQLRPVSIGVNLMIVGAVVCVLLQGIRAVTVGIYKMSVLAHSQAVVEQHYETSVEKNQALKEKIRRYSSKDGIEELARNYLQMVGQREILVRNQ